MTDTLDTKGQMMLVSILTGSTCGEACWEAREDICRCSCGGRNHGCLRSPDGVRPTRAHPLGLNLPAKRKLNAGRSYPLIVTCQLTSLCIFCGLRGYHE